MKTPFGAVNVQWRAGPDYSQYPICIGTRKKKGRNWSDKSIADKNLLLLQQKPSGTSLLAISWNPRG